MNQIGAPLIVAIRGPILLITLGGLFAMEQFDSFSFSRTWPILIIVFGVLKLLERSATREETGA
jgi:cell wall-active antibiotic response 4TMS protein YvqF